MPAHAESKQNNMIYKDRVWELSRALSRRFTPAFEIRPKKESEFLSRLLAMTLLMAMAGGIFALLPQWHSRSWFEGALMGVVLSLAATRRNAALARRISMGALFGVGLQAFTQMGFPFVGVAVMGGGIGAQMSNVSDEFKVKLDTVLFTILAALLAAWSIARLGPLLQFGMPHTFAKAGEWALIGMFFSLGAIPMHIVISSNAFLIRVRSIRRKLNKYYRAYLDRMLDKYLALGKIDLEKNSDELISFLSRKETLEQAVLKTAESALALQQVDQSLRAISEDSLRNHQRELSCQYDNLKDPAIRGELDKLISGIEESLTRREKLKLERERLKLQLFRAEMDMATDFTCR